MPGIMCLEYIPYCAIVSGAHKKSDTRTYVQLTMSKTSFLVSVLCVSVHSWMAAAAAQKRQDLTTKKSCCFFVYVHLAS